MQEPSFDPGLTQQYSGRLRRTINPDGTFNVIRRGTSWRDVHPYLHLVSMSWPSFFGAIFLAYIAANLVFACFYFLLGPGAIQGNMPINTSLDRFLQDFYFSSQTLTTVGFGSIAPASHAANMLAALESFCGLLLIAVATGVLLGRVSRPSARIGFSEKAMITPYQDGYAFQFRLVNRRVNTLMELSVTVLLMTVDPAESQLKRNFEVLPLERDKVLFFPLTWTVVHPIGEKSPLRGKTKEDLERFQAEFLVQVKAWDETFSQIVQQRYSYIAEQVVFDGKFVPAFTVVEDGSLALEVNKVGDHIQLELK